MAVDNVKVIDGIGIGKNNDAIIIDCVIINKMIE